MKKGFTLIELLAVIVVLAIIALIVTPVISRVIAGAKKSATEQSITAYVKAVDTTNQASMLLDNPSTNNANTTRMGVDIKDINVEVNGKKPEEGFVDIVNNRVIRAVFCIDNYIAEYLGGKIDMEETEDCKKEVKYVTYDTSDTEDMYAEIEASTPDPSWVNYIKLTTYGDFIAEVALCNKSNGKTVCTSSNDNLTKANLVKESNNGILTSNICHDSSSEWIAAKEQKKSAKIITSFFCRDGVSEYQNTKFNYNETNSPLETSITVLSGIPNSGYISPSCEFQVSYGYLDAFADVDKYMNMSKNDFMNLTVDDILEFVKAQYMISMTVTVADTGEEISNPDITEEIIDEMLERMRTTLASDEELFNGIREQLYVTFRELKFVKLGGNMLYYHCYHKIGS